MWLKLWLFLGKSMGIFCECIACAYGRCCGVVRENGDDEREWIPGERSDRLKIKKTDTSIGVAYRDGAG